MLDTQRHQVERSGRPIELTPKEFALLEYLMRNAEHVVSRAMITEKVWGYSFDSYSNLIDVHINHLRKKMDRDFEPKLVHTVKGVGYYLGRRERQAG
jgi:DNA-binding response OmpR family regulator